MIVVLVPHKRTSMKLLSIILGLTTLLCPVASLAQISVGADECRNEVHLRLWKEQRLYRSVLLGHQSAEDANIGSVYYDKEGNAWYKVSKTAWRSRAEGYEGTEWSNTLMDQQSELSARRGILNTKRVLTSELIPYMTSNMHALQCNTASICQLVEKSLQIGSANPQLFNLAAAGCMPLANIPSIPQCQLANAQDTSQMAGIFRYCEDITNNLLEQEADQLRMVTEYDAAYRTLLQFAGNFDLFLEEFQWTVTGTLRTGARVIGALGRIPCFIASCDEPIQDSTQNP